MKITALIDLDSIIFACFNGNKIPDGNGGWQRIEDGKRLLYTEKTPEEVIQACDTIFSTILTECGATHHISFIKGKDTIKERLKVNPEYKQDRNKEEPKYWKLCSDHFVNKWGAHLANGLETDDALNICKHTRNLLFKDSFNFLCCIDSDLLGTEGTHWDWKKKIWVYSSEENERLRLWTDMIVGTHNNVKGIPGKGVKYAEKLFEKLNCKTDLEYAELVFSSYLANYGNVDRAITEYFKNYKCVKLLTFKEGFEIPTPIEFKPIEEVPQIEEDLPDFSSTISQNDFEKGLNFIEQTEFDF